MKKYLFFLIVVVFVATAFVCSDSAEPKLKKIPAVKIKDLKGGRVSTTDFKNNGKPIIINFWATWCKPCILELNNLHEIYPQWQKETGVKIIAISVDDTRNSSKVAPFVKGRDWTYEVYLDENSDLRRALNVNNPPHTFLLNGDGEVVWEHNGYAPGDEKELFQEIKKLSSK